MSIYVNMLTIKYVCDQTFYTNEIPYQLFITFAINCDDDIEEISKLNSYVMEFWFF